MNLITDQKLYLFEFSFEKLLLAFSKHNVLKWLMSPVKATARLPWVQFACLDVVRDFELDYPDQLAPNQLETGFADGMCFVTCRDSVV